MAIRTHRTAFSTLYLVLLMPVLSGFVAFGVDWGRVQVARTELQRAADAAARAAASLVPDDLTGARTLAKQYAAANRADGSSVILTNTDIEFGTWNETARTFTPGTGFGIYQANAVRVTASRTAAKGNALPLLFARLIGQNTCDVKAVSVVEISGGNTVTINVPGTSDPYLSGMPAGSHASGVDSAPTENPQLVSAIKLVPGSVLTFTFSGAVRNNPNYHNFDPDGNLGWILSHDAGAENGIANVRMPINAQLGVFLTDARPDATSAPAALDFSSAASRDFDTLKPALKQPFFIGDGMNSRGTVQQFIVPPGATRLYLGTMDGFEWKNNLGSFTTTVTMPKVIRTVK